MGKVPGESEVWGGEGLQQGSDVIESKLRFPL